MSDEIAQAGEPLEAPRSPRGSMTPSPLADGTQPGLRRDPAESLTDPRALQILSAEHSSLLSARTLAYNEAFTRGGMFLTFLSMSFVAIALLAQAFPADGGFLPVAVIVLAVDFVLGLTTYGRIIVANYEDYRAVYGMARIRHAYGEIAPVILPYFTTSLHDDLAGVMVTYGSPPTTMPGALLHALTTAGGMISLIVSMIGGVLALVVTLMLGASVGVGFGVGALAAIVVFVALGALTYRFYMGVQARLEVLFPTPTDGIEQAT
jgi:hypothetical protein